MQVIFKSSKPLSVMVLGLLICKRYVAIQRYFFVLIIVIGVVMFKLFEIKEELKSSLTNSTDINTVPSKKTETFSENQKMFGMALLVVSLLMDGILGTIQDTIRAKYSPSSRNFMLSMCGYAALISNVIAICTGEVIDLYGFMCRHSEVIWNIALYAICCVFGQLFIYTMVANFGALACSVTTTVRKFFSVLFSIIFFGNPSTSLQWVGVILVFTGLFADAFFGKIHTKQSHQNDVEMTDVTTKQMMDNSEERPKAERVHSTQQNEQEIT